MILAIVQARVSSTRLPGKVLKKILGRPMLWRQLERLSEVSTIDKLIVATSVRDDDNELVDLCGAFGVECFRGSLDDVLDRFYQAANAHEPEHVVRLTGDCPLTDPELIDQVIQFHLEGDFDYSSNVIEPTFPDGLDVEVARFSCLRQAWCEADLASEREHVTPFIWKRPQRFRIGSFRNDKDLSHLRWTVDEAADFEFVVRVFEALYEQSSMFTTEDILRFLEVDSGLSELNAAIERNDGYRKSLEDDMAGRRE